MKVRRPPKTEVCKSEQTVAGLKNIPLASLNTSPMAPPAAPNRSRVYLFPESPRRSGLSENEWAEVGPACGRTSAPAAAATPNNMREWEERHVPGAGERGDGVQGMGIEVEVRGGGEFFFLLLFKM